MAIRWFLIFQNVTILHCGIFELDKFHLKYDKKESFPNRNLGQKIYKNLRRALKYHVIKEREVYHNRDHRYDVNDIDPRVYRKKDFEINIYMVTGSTLPILKII